MKIQLFKAIFFLLLGYLFQITFLNFVRINTITPDLLLLLLIFISLQETNIVKAIAFGFLASLLLIKDLGLSNFSKAGFLVLYIIISALSSYINKKSENNNILTFLTLVMVCSFLVGLLPLASSREFFKFALWRITLPCCFYNVVLASILYFPFKKMLNV